MISRYYLSVLAHVKLIFCFFRLFFAVFCFAKFCLTLPEEWKHETQSRRRIKLFGDKKQLTLLSEARYPNLEQGIRIVGKLYNYDFNKI